MSTQLEFYLERAAQAHADADAATLSNVRERYRRSAVAWDAMAARLQWGERQRLENEAAKTAIVARLGEDGSKVSIDGD